MKYYFAWGLTFASDLALDGMQASEPVEAPDVTIAEGEVPPHLEGDVQSSPWHEATEHELIVTVKDVARFHIENGNKITIAKEADALPEKVKLYLFGSCMGAILHQRGLVAMHASAVLVEGNAVLFTGQSGAGKSTMAYALGQAGYEVLCDDIAVLEVTDGRPMVRPGVPQQKMWRESLQRLGVPPKELQQVRPEIEKFYDDRHGGSTLGPVPISTMYVLMPGPDEALSVEDIEGAGRMMAIKNNLYRPKFMEHMGREPEMFPIMAAMANHVKMARIRRPGSDNSIPSAMTFVMNNRAGP